jgi:DNA-binding CsgD family transcriptional regulator
LFDSGREQNTERLRDADEKRGLALAQRRCSPKFFIADRASNVLVCSPDLLDSPLLDACLDVLQAALADDPSHDGPAFEPLDAQSLLRIIPLSGQYPESFAVFIEQVDGRNAIETAVKRYDVTKRESEVLALLVRGFSTQRIAQHLFISEGTVADHVKSLLRKTRTNKRSELISRIFHHDHDGVSRLDRTGRRTE